MDRWLKSRLVECKNDSGRLGVAASSSECCTLKTNMASVQETEFCYLCRFLIAL